MRQNGMEGGEGLRRERWDEPTVELFREYLMEVVRMGGASRMMRFAWSDN